MIFAEIIIYTAFVYLAIGFLFAVWFAVSGVTTLDDSAKETSFGFRLIIFFGAAAFWALLAWRVVKVEKRPAEKNAHRLEAKNDPQNSQKT